jgi:hypothetical protein
MFIVVQLPFADVRGLLADQAGRLARPDWTADDPGLTFIRGFGKMAARNDKSFGLHGERYFADFDNAVRLRKVLFLEQKGLPEPLEAELWFRRLYFDGGLAGRFEFGFIVLDRDERPLRGKKLDPRIFAGQALASPVEVLTPGQTQGPMTTIGQCAEALGHAYLAATTRQDALARHPPGETYGQAVAIGPPLVHIRVSNGLRIDVGRDLSESKGTDGRVFFTSATGSGGRNNVLVQLSKGGSQAESGEERATRVLFAHLHALMFAQSHFLQVRQGLDLKDRVPLLESVNGMIQRLRSFKPTTPQQGNDEAFAGAISQWADRYTDRAENLAKSLDAIAADAAEPTAVQKGLGWMDAIFQLILKTSVEAAVKLAVKP